MTVDIHDSFSTILSRMTAAKPEIMKRHMALLEQRYDLSNRPAQGVRMSGGKAVQQGVRVKLTGGTSWDQLSKLSPEQIKERSLYPAGFEPLPHPNHPEGGMLFPKFEIDEAGQPHHEGAGFPAIAWPPGRDARYMLRRSIDVSLTADDRR